MRTRGQTFTAGEQGVTLFDLMQMLPEIEVSPQEFFELCQMLNPESYYQTTTHDVWSVRAEVRVRVVR